MDEKYASFFLDKILTAYNIRLSLAEIKQAISRAPETG